MTPFFYESENLMGNITYKKTSGNYPEVFLRTYNDVYQIKIYFRINSTAKIYIGIDNFLKLPANRLIST